MNAKPFKPFVWLLTLMVAVSMACNLGSTPAPSPTEAPPPKQQTEPTKPPEPTAPPEPTTPAEPTQVPGLVTNLQDVKKAVIQIESQGTFVDPQFGVIVNGAGRGSGFIIDPSGIAVTNNHVVTGAALLKVWVGGETTPRNAKILGVSECSDLAVIDIEGSGYPYLEWYPGDVTVGTDMYVAGFPLGDPEFSLNKGIISKANANGATSWASVEHVIEYDATTNPGNSGGPVVDTSGKVLGVHFAANSQARQAFGIGHDIAEQVIPELESGKNVDTIGVNGQAVSSEDGSITGVWVSSVQSGSPADKAGIKPADIITMMENLVLATDGTMGDYCDILRSHKPGDTLGITVLRWPTQEVLDGQLNGRILEVTGSASGGSSSSGSSSSGSTAPGVTYNPNATDPGDLYYATTFDSPLDDWNWFLNFGKEQNFSSKVADGKFRTEINARETYVYYIYNDLIFTDVQIEVTSENFGANTNWAGIVCRYSDDGWYEVNILSTGEFGVFRFDTVKKKYVTMYTGGSTLINTGKDTNKFTVVCAGDQITVGINGTKVKTVSMKTSGYGPLKDGKIGLTVQATSVYPVIIEFDDFKAGVPY
jgi:S1-C subfamily serine protease